MLMARKNRMIRVAPPLIEAINRFHEKLNNDLSINTNKVQATDILGKILLDKRIIEDLSFEINHYPRTSRKDIDLKVKP